jgi:hypothetical protein
MYVCDHGGKHVDFGSSKGKLSKNFKSKAMQTNYKHVLLQHQNHNQDMNS